jgi:hypothetical protein
MNKKWIAINLILLAAAFLLGRELMRSIQKVEEASSLPMAKSAAGARQKAKPAPSALKAPAAPAMPNASQVVPAATAPAVNAPVDYSVINQKNLFAETRSNVISADAVAPSEPPPLVQKPILIGILNTEKGWQASIIDPASQDRNRRSQSKRVGDVYHGYVIKEILSDKIVLESGSRQEIIPLFEGYKRGQSGKTAGLVSRVIPFGRGTTAGTQPGGAVTVQPVGAFAGAAGITAPGGQGPQAGPGLGQSTIIQSGGNTIRIPQTNPIQSQPQPQGQQPKPATQSSQPSGTDTQGRRVIRTPFGDLPR